MEKKRTKRNSVHQWIDNRGKKCFFFNLYCIWRTAFVGLRNIFIEMGLRRTNIIDKTHTHNVSLRSVSSLFLDLWDSIQLNCIQYDCSRLKTQSSWRKTKSKQTSFSLDGKNCRKIKSRSDSSKSKLSVFLGAKWIEKNYELRTIWMNERKKRKRKSEKKKRFIQ